MFRLFIISSFCFILGAALTHADAGYRGNGGGRYHAHHNGARNSILSQLLQGLLSPPAAQPQSDATQPTNSGDQPPFVRTQIGWIANPAFKGDLPQIIRATEFNGTLLLVLQQGRNADGNLCIQFRLNNEFSENHAACQGANGLWLPVD